MGKKWLIRFLLIAVFGVFLLVGTVFAAEYFSDKKTVKERIAEFGDEARNRMKPYFEQAKVTYPPKQLTFIGLKEEKTLELWVVTGTGKRIFIRDYPILAASGVAGPKLREGDRQVPEGFYGIESLNPNSRYHVSLRVSYPNDEDRKHGKEENRERLGGDIMIHGKSASIGCLAMGDPAAEELFTLAADIGQKHVTVIIVPCDFRKKGIPEIPSDSPVWVSDLYKRLDAELKRYGR